MNLTYRGDLVPVRDRWRGKAACARRAGDKLGIGAHSAPSENGARGSDLAHTGAPGLLEADRDSNMKRKQVTRAKVILIRARPPSPRSRNGGARAGRSTRSPEPSLGRARQVDLCGPPPPGSYLVPGCARPSGFGSQIRSGLKLSFRFALDHDGRPARAHKVAIVGPQIGVDRLVHNVETTEKRFDEFARAAARQARNPRATPRTSSAAWAFVSRVG